MAAKRDLGKALANSLLKKPETRFAKADDFFKTGPKGEQIAPNAPRRAPSSAPAEKVIRDTFSFPQADYDLIRSLQARLLAKGTNCSKSEVLRLGLLLLEKLKDNQLQEHAGQLQRLKPGRRRTT